MVSVSLRVMAGFAGVVWALWVWARHYDPQGKSGWAVRHGVLGLTLLLGWNLVSPMSLGVNPLSVLTAGVLGAPGVGLLAVIAMLP